MGGYSEWGGGESEPKHLQSGSRGGVCHHIARRWLGTGWRKKNRHGIKKRISSYVSAGIIYAQGRPSAHPIRALLIQYNVYSLTSSISALSVEPKIFVQ